MAKLKLEIVTPESKVFSDDVDMVVLPGVEGQLGILPMHVPLLTQLLPGELHIMQGGKQEDIVVGTGFVEVSQTQVSVLTDMAMGEAEIDESATEQAVKRAEADLASKDLTGEQVGDVQASLARSLAALKFKRRRKSV
jgi:F-type H+-transporting ATPase subunit epsilon